MNAVNCSESITTWEETSLWRLLNDKQGQDAKEVRKTLSEWMPKVEKLLRQGGTSPKDFTLHDDAHALRVAERMACTIPDDVLAALSHYELALLLLSAYLHDIGMVPEQKKVERHYIYLLSGNADGLTADEASEFQEWLLDSSDEASIPLSDGQSTPQSLRLASHLVAHYCRSKHVDWGEEWVLSNLGDATLGTYKNWVDDLATLCRSHHQGYQDLIERRFDPKQVGEPARHVHLRYLASVLRIADILEFDPERTPDVIYEHRDIDPTSAIYWHKDHYISWSIENHRLTVSAEPPNAVIHRAIESMANEIEAELRLVRRLNDEKAFAYSSFQDAALPHRWDLRSDVRRVIRPKDGAYEYIDGSFRPNTKKILQLLSGRRLYGDKLVAVRELLQNAIDGIRVQIAYERLVQQVPSDPTLATTLGRLHKVRLWFGKADEEYFLECSDDGIGMTKALIRDRLLVSGAMGKEIRALQQRCKEAGFELGTTSEFGIGVLSYFMLAESVTIQTRRGDSAGDADNTSWSFRASGIGTFGELKRTDGIGRGTTVRLALKDGIIDDPIKWYAGLQDYLRKNIVHIPCPLRLESSVDGCEPFTLQDGWTRTTDELAEAALTVSVDDLTRRVTKDDVRLRIANETVEKITESLTWDTVEGELEGNLGVYRIHVPIFDLAGGKSRVYLPTEIKGRQIVVHPIEQDEMSEDTYGLQPQSLHCLLSWRGVGVQPGPPKTTEEYYAVQTNNLIIEIDLRNQKCGNLLVSRAEIEISDDLLKAITIVKEHGKRLLKDFANENKDSVFASLNGERWESDLPDSKKSYWLYRSESGPAKWSRVDFPAVDGSDLPRRAIGLPSKVLWNGGAVTPVSYLSMMSARGASWGIGLVHLRTSPDRIVVICPQKDALLVVPLWTRSPKSGRSDIDDCHVSSFPPSWQSVVGYQSGNHKHGVIWNASHWLMQGVTSEGLDWVKETFDLSGEQPLDPTVHKSPLLQERVRATAWMYRALQKTAQDAWKYDGHGKVWDELAQADQRLTNDIWSFVCGRRKQHTDKILLIYQTHHREAVLLEFSREGCKMVATYSEIMQRIQTPDSQWELVVEW